MTTASGFGHHDGRNATSFLLYVYYVLTSWKQEKMEEKTDNL